MSSPQAALVRPEGHLAWLRPLRVVPLVLVAMIVVAVLGLVACAPSVPATAARPAPTATSSAPPRPGSTPTAAQGALVAMIDALPVSSSTPPAKYVRADFGAAWADTDRNGCDTRNDVLARDLLDAQTKPDTRGCVVTSGVLHDPYTGTTLTWTKAGGGIDIDHVVPLEQAWAAGAWTWTTERREQFANDLPELQATVSSTNRAKGDSPIQTWTPPDPTYLCTYTTRWVQTKTTWQLTVTQDEKTRLLHLATNC